MKYIGIDNGVTGSIGVVDERGFVAFRKTPSKIEQHYTKKVSRFTRIDVAELISMFKLLPGEKQAWLERPMVNPGRFRSTISALMAFEATRVALELCKIKCHYIDSKEWQKALLPEGVRGDALKAEGDKLVEKLFPKVEFKRGGGAEGLLIAYYIKVKEEHTNGSNHA